MLVKAAVQDSLDVTYIRSCQRGNPGFQKIVRRSDCEFFVLVALIPANLDIVDYEGAGGIILQYPFYDLPSKWDPGLWPRQLRRVLEQCNVNGSYYILARLKPIHVRRKLARRHFQIGCCGVRVNQFYYVH